ncbi:hypothetical protein PHYBLDRAFT_142611 [Phycomyces blakesleeanus NRRL 1555(-)]|uniref:Uncharacterized protein n=1 Tax=Phycomyces blakesleeanus (strain ATCC 8743b / DSM 1359 / FGSC 10004 / NBRC 33097 / NRRL 1555) TaxID=763407 RepID=A0A162PY71_PHYB8|nr:hypothetical protein PHYBLDRAFT_142611 [Phycomyces blakesleeanus NRRL 1555(-)]OAD77097.1 hypothetical protein PHYBLDRAFT_142611 [Phycomyces blakesleeanus NRRL 1555(-)]|eukprot:XP_018295137.1 hypothetical protein PHYBLDRAFT_142611 [Phycomyces blakesleeanus NRRL 1555(-)]
MLKSTVPALKISASLNLQGPNKMIGNFNLSLQIINAINLCSLITPTSLEIPLKMFNWAEIQALSSLVVKPSEFTMTVLSSPPI